MLALFSLALFSSGCPRPRTSTPDPVDPQPIEKESVSPEALAFQQQGDAAFLMRDDPVSLSEAIKAYEAAAALDATNVRTRIRLGRAYEIAGWLAEENPQTAREAGSLYYAGLVFTRQALDLLSPGVDLMLSEGQFREAFGRFEEQHAPAVYQYAALLWRWLGTQGRATQLARRDEALAAAQKAVGLNPNLWGAAPYRLLGEIYAALPSFAGGDLGLSRSYFEKAFSVAPQVLQNRVSCAKTYAPRADPSLAEALWEEILSADPSQPLALAPENRLAQRFAAQALSGKKGPEPLPPAP